MKIVLLFTNDIGVDVEYLERKLNTYNGVTFEVILTDKVDGWKIETIDLTDSSN